MARLKANIQDHETARRFLGNAADRTLGHNTRVSLCPAGIAEGSIAVWFHRTAIIRYYQDGGFRLDSGGWRTVTTADRLRQLLPPGFRLESREGSWIIVDHRPTHRNPDREAWFTDGMFIDTVTAGNPFLAKVEV
jgi:hypothetical protein